MRCEGSIVCINGNEICISVVVPTSAWATDGGEDTELIMQVEEMRPDKQRIGTVIDRNGDSWGSCALSSKQGVWQSGTKVRLTQLKSDVAILVDLTELRGIFC